jgi:hypothetical protein
MHIIADASGWLAMALLDNGGWMSDHENVPLILTDYMGLEIMKQPGFKSWGLHVPALIHSELFKNTISPADMLVLLSLHENLSEEEMDCKNCDVRLSRVLY